MSLRGVERDPQTVHEQKCWLRKQVDYGCQYVVAGGIATGIIHAIGASLTPSAALTLGVGLTLGLGLGAFVYLGALIAEAIFMKTFQYGFKNKYAKWKKYDVNIKGLYRERDAAVRSDKTNWLAHVDEIDRQLSALRKQNKDVAWINPLFSIISALGTLIVAFFIITSCVGPLGVGSFIGVFLLMCLISVYLPKASNIYHYFNGIARPNREESQMPLVQRLLGAHVKQRIEAAERPPFVCESYAEV